MFEKIKMILGESKSTDFNFQLLFNGHSRGKCFAGSILYAARQLLYEDEFVLATIREAGVGEIGIVNLNSGHTTKMIITPNSQGKCNLYIVN